MSGVDLQSLALPGAILILFTSLALLTFQDERASLGILGLQYIGVFILVDASWPLEMAVAKMIAGWMSGAILGMAMTSTSSVWDNSEKSIKLGPLFRILAAIIVVLTISSLVLHSQLWLSKIDIELRWGSFILIGLGILQLSLTSHPFRIIIALLTALSGFEILYAAIETSTLVTGLLAGVNLGLALVGAYLLISPTMETNP